MKKLPIVSAIERMAERKGVKLLMLGKSGIGKTTRLKDLDPATTLFLDIEAGDLAVADWPGVMELVPVHLLPSTLMLLMLRLLWMLLLLRRRRR